jgi:enoyl-CoA hydratase/carnithine racemase
VEYQVSEQVRLEVHGHVARLEFCNPPQNFATIALLRGIADALESLDDDAQVRAVVLSAEGKVFCAGADLASPEGLGTQNDDPLREFYEQAIRLYSVRKPIVAAVRGAAIGAGLGLAVAADFRVVSTEARFSANFTRLGFHPGFGLTYTLPRLIGPQHATEMFLTGERYRPEAVAAWGLVDRIVGAEKLVEEALSFAAKIAVNAPLALLATRATLRAGILDAVGTALTLEHAEQLKLKDSEDFAEGVRAMNERRSANFKGR